MLYIATAIPVDEDIERAHPGASGTPGIPSGGTYEGYRDLGEVVSSTEKDTILLDCVTVLITNILMEDEKDFDKLTSREI